MRPVSVNRGGQWTSFTTFHFIPSGWLGNCMSKINLLFVITFVSKKIETWDQCQSIEGDSGHLSQPSILSLVADLGIACPKLTYFCNNFCQQKDRDTRPVSINRGGQWTSFTTFHFIPSGWFGNCMSKINLLFVITFVSKKIETRDQCQSIEGDSGHLSQLSILSLVADLGIACPKLTYFL